MRVSKGKEGMLKARKNGREDVIGQHIRVRIVKNKTAPPFKEGEIKVYFDGRGFDDTEEIALIALNNGIVPRFNAAGERVANGRYYKWEAEPQFLAKSKAEIPDQLRAFPDVKAALLKIIIEGNFDDYTLAGADGDEEDDEDDTGLDDEAFEELLAGGREAEEIETED